MSRKDAGIAEGFLRDIGDRLKFRYLGLGFLWAWIYATWFTPVVFPDSVGLTVSNDVSWLVSAATVALTLFVSPLALRDREASTMPFLVKGAGPLTSLGAVMMASHPLFGADLPLLPIAGALLTGVASGWLWMLWGEFTGKVDQEVSELFVPLCVAVPLVTMFISSFVSGPVAGLAVCFLPLVSGFLLQLSLGDASVLEPVSLLPADERPKLFGDFMRVGLASLAVYACVGFAWGMMDYGSMTGWGDTHLVPYVLGALLAIAAVVFSITYASTLDLFGLYRWLVPVILAGLIFLSVESFWTRFLSLLLITVGQYGFDVVVWVYFSRLVRKGVCPGSLAAGVNRGFVQVGVLIGSLVALAAPRLAASWGGSLQLIALVLSAVMTTVVLMVIDRKGELGRVTGFEARSSSAADAAVIDYDAVCDRLAAKCGLTAREREILGYLARGRSLPYIREALVLSKNTVSTHAKNLYKKLDIHSRQDLFDLIESLS